MKLTRLTLLLFYLFTHIYASAQETVFPDFYLQHFTDENGLPQNSIKGIMKDNRGFVWLATEDGLARFDGQRFYTFNKTTIPISSNRMHVFLPAINTYSIKNKEFYAFSENIEYIRILPDGSVAVDSSYYHNLLNNAPFAKDIGGNINIAGSLPSYFPKSERCLVPAGNNNFYVWFRDKIEYYHQRTRQYTAVQDNKEFFLINSHPYATLNTREFVKIHPGSKSRTVELTGDITANPSYSKQKQNYKLFWNNISQKAYLYLNLQFYTLEESPDGKSLTTKLVLSGFDFEQFKITTAYYDDDLHYLYLGSATSGLYLLRRKEFHTLKMPEKNSDNFFYSQIADSPNSILSAQGYSLGLDTRSEKRTAVIRSVLMKKNNALYYLAPDVDSSFWMGISSRLFKFDKTGKKVLKEITLKEKFKALYLDKKGQLWLGGEKDILFRMNTRDSSNPVVTAIRSHFSEIRCIEQEAPDVLLLGTLKGLYRFHIKSARLEPIKGLENIHIRSLYCTDNGTWITTYGDGFYLFSEKKLTKFPLDKDQFLATSHCVTEDSKGYFWITTNKGLFQAAKQDLLNFAAGKQTSVFYLYYDKRHGFETNEFNGGCQPCAVKLADGRISLPSMDGVVWFSPDQIKPELPDKEIFITRAELDGSIIPANNQMEIPRDFEQLRLYLSTPYLENIRNVQMSYSIKRDNRHAVWLPLSDDFIISLSNVTSGNYTLTIRKMNGFGANNYAYKSLRFYVAPAWYETWWFRSLVIILLLLLFVGILKSRTKYLVNKERDRALHRHYRISNHIVTAINHDIQTPLHYINNSLEQLYSFLEQQNQHNPGIMQMNLETLNTSRRISTLTKNLLNYIKVQSDNKIRNVQIGTVDVYELVKQSCLLFSGIANFNKIEIINLVGNNFVVQSDKKLLSIIVHNLMDNAVKASTTQVTISSIINDGEQIIISDTGDGMPRELIEWINKSYKSYDEWMRVPEYPDPNGVGLIIVKDLCALLNIRLTAESIPGLGTNIRIIFARPLKTDKPVQLKGLRSYLHKYFKSLTM